MTSLPFNYFIYISVSLTLFYQPLFIYIYLSIYVIIGSMPMIMTAAQKNELWGGWAVWGKLWLCVLDEAILIRMVGQCLIGEPNED